MHPFGKAWWCGVAVGVMIVAAVVGPRLMSTFAIIGCLLLLLDRLANRSAIAAGPPLGSNRTERAAFAVVIGFALWSMMTALWSPTPAHSLLKPLFLILATALVWLAVARLRSLSPPYVHYIGEGALTGIVLGLVLVSVELLFNQVIARSLMTWVPAFHENIPKHVEVRPDGTVAHVSDANLNRRTALLTWMFWPGLALAICDPSRVRRWVSYGVLAAALVVIILYGLHQTSQMALGLSALVLLLCRFVDPNIVRRALMVAWAAAVLLVVPVAHFSFEAGLHNADWLFRTARHRVVIWGTTAGEILESPIIGVGADATPVAMKEATLDQKLSDSIAEFGSGYAPHAHNVYLQVWYELGAIGALLFAAVGVLALRALAPLQRDEQAFALTVFSATALLIAFSYSLWQTWFLASLALSVCLLALAIRKRSDRQGNT